MESPAQLPITQSLYTDNYTINPDDKGALGLSIDNISFLRNNESDGDVQDGYTVPGFRLMPRVTFQPSPIVRLEGGISLLRYWGADKYPNYAYQDIAEWKSDSYQHGFHFLPFFRAQIQPIPQINIVLGSLYGGGNHRLIEPLYNPELNYTADSETGIQFLYNSRVAHLDAWVNWESFIFKNDKHKEALTIGGSACLHITDPKSFFYVGIPVQALVIHHGGEIDSIGDKKIISLANGATGLRFQTNFDNEVFKNISLDVMGAGYQSFSREKDEEDLFYTKGWGFYSNLTFQVWNLNVKMAYWRSGDFINLFGNQVFGNVSQTIPDRTFPKTEVFNPGLKYEQCFGNGFYLGADVEFFYNPKLIAYRDNEIAIKTSKSFGWSTGLYLRINPSMILKKYTLN